MGVMGFVRELGDRKIAVVLNLTSAPVEVHAPELEGSRVDLGTHLDRDGVLRAVVRLRADEGLVATLR
jgi:hypothetical protein